MSPIWAILLVLVIFAVVLRLKGRSKRKLKVPVYSRRIEGFQVMARLEPEMSSGCLFDHGTQFGKGFRRKEGPELPHAGNCRCTTVRFSFTSNEVFNGALREFARIDTDFPGIRANLAPQLAELMKGVESPKAPETLEAYLAAIDLGPAGAKSKDAVREFLTARFAFLRGGGKSALPEPSSDAEVATES